MKFEIWFGFYPGAAEALRPPPMPPLEMLGNVMVITPILSFSVISKLV